MWGGYANTTPIYRLVNNFLLKDNPIYLLVCLNCKRLQENELSRIFQAQVVERYPQILQHLLTIYKLAFKGKLKYKKTSILNNIYYYYIARYSQIYPFLKCLKRKLEVAKNQSP
tara:strand:- start:907 stop:1248 length:342 start_codon:yes stop_codon:yes gene_type:complete